MRRMFKLQIYVQWQVGHVPTGNQNLTQTGNVHWLNASNTVSLENCIPHTLELVLEQALAKTCL